MDVSDLNLLNQHTLTFGVELEVLVAWLWEDEVDPKPETAGTLPPIIRIPLKEKQEMIDVFGASPTEDQVQDYIYGLMRKTFEENGLRATPGEYTMWDVKGDSSVVSTTDPNGDYSWLGAEIVSPILTTSSEGFGAVRSVVDLLTSKYRMTLNHTCGFHVHVGDGVKFWSVEQTRRICAFLWAADPILATLHPPSRRLVEYAQSIRERSHLAKGSKVGDMPTYDEHYNEACDLYRSGRITGKVMTPRSPLAQTIEKQIKMVLEMTVPIKSQYKGPYVPSTSRTMDRLAYPSFVIELDKPGNLDRKATSDLGVFWGVAQLLNARTTCELDWLLEAGERANYSLRAYYCGNDPPNPGTIEFREAAGTIQGQWVETWARICTGLIIFALYSPVDSYVNVLHNIDRAARGGVPYDVVDLLDQCGLGAEVLRFVQARLTTYKDRWGLKFVPKTS